MPVFRHDVRLARQVGSAARAGQPVGPEGITGSGPAGPSALPLGRIGRNYLRRLTDEALGRR